MEIVEPLLEEDWKARRFPVGAPVGLMISILSLCDKFQRRPKDKEEFISQGKKSPVWLQERAVALQFVSIESRPPETGLNCESCHDS